MQYAKLKSQPTITPEQKTLYETNRQSAIHNLQEVLKRNDIVRTTQEEAALKTLLRDIQIKIIN